ncbi:MAG: hypothetical protein F6K09_16590 [Merismopedia sp. SIO2A8]|nr:hypothetical protein [Merismopedia sp. SIO2A8]
MMTLLYCFGNATLAQRVIAYMQQRWRSHLHCVTVLFLNDRWMIRFTLKTTLGPDRVKDSCAFLDENGIVYVPSFSVTHVLNDLNQGCTPVAVMKRHNVAIVSHGPANPDEVRYFQEHVVAGLGYCPQSLV